MSSLSFLRAAAMTGALLAGAALAAPGAHGPNGEHLDGPVAVASGTAAPRLEASSELFELVATFSGRELSLLIDRFASNEPVLGAEVEVEAGALRAIARFQADHGSYAIDDPALLAALATPGEHALVFTVAAGADTDLLEGTLRVSPQEAHDEHGHFFTWRRAAVAGALLLAGGVAGVALRRRVRPGGLQ